MDELNAREIGKKYASTAGLIRQKITNKLIPVQFVDLRQSDASTYSFLMQCNSGSRDAEQVVKGRGFSLTEFELPLHQFEIVPMPDRQAFDYGGISYVFSRYPERQYRKGICGNNTSIKSPVEGILNNIPSRTEKYELLPNGELRIDMKTLYNLLQPNYPDSFQEALKQIADWKLMSRTLTKEYILCLFPHEEKQYLLCRLDVPVAFYNKDKDEFTVINPLFYQEVTDFCRRQQLNSRINHVS